MNCVIMRGVPGSGKSTWIKNNYPDPEYPKMQEIFSADHYHINDAGVYEFKPENIRKAHNHCLIYFTQMSSLGSGTTLIVDNTNIRVWEIAPYYRLAEAFGYDVEIIHVHADPVVAAKRTIHGVPPGRVLEMHRSIEPVPAWWNQRSIYPKDQSE